MTFHHEKLETFPGKQAKMNMYLSILPFNTETIVEKEETKF